MPGPCYDAPLSYRVERSCWRGKTYTAAGTGGNRGAGGERADRGQVGTRCAWARKGVRCVGEKLSKQVREKAG